MTTESKMREFISAANCLAADARIVLEAREPPAADVWAALSDACDRFDRAASELGDLDAAMAKPPLCPNCAGEIEATGDCYFCGFSRPQVGDQGAAADLDESS